MGVWAYGRVGVIEGIIVLVVVIVPIRGAWKWRYIDAIPRRRSPIENDDDDEDDYSSVKTKFRPTTQFDSLQRITAYADTLTRRYADTIPLLRNPHQQVPFFAGGRERRQITSGRTLGDFASGIEGRAVTPAIKRMVVLRLKLALLMCAIRGKGGHFPGLPDHEEPEIAVPIVQAV
jgi:hypothetical protein